jgi:protein-S-isoprenylcysteine O-methyltransferase Ste14
MNVPGVAWVGLVLLLIPVVQVFVQAQWPEASYPITALIVGVLAALAKWLQLYFQQDKILPPPAAAKPRAIGETGASTPPPAAVRWFSAKKWLVG